MTPTAAARQILALAERASPGPWKYYPATEDGLVKVQMGDDHVVDWDLEGTCSECFANMELIAHARNHGPNIARALLDAEERIAALEAENVVMRKCLTDIRDNYDCDRDATWHERHCRCCKSDAALSYKYAPTLTPEGGEK